MSHGGWRGYETRPAWWPEDEPFPPPRLRSSYAMQRRFVRRMALVFVAFVALVITGAFTLFWWIVSALGLIRPGGQPPFWSDHPEGPPFFFIPVFVVLGFVLLGRMFRGVARPAGDLIVAAGRLEAGSYDVRVALRGPREMRSLARAFNALAARLQTTEAQRTQLLADVTHELRTPLTVMQGNVEALLDGVRPIDRGHIAPLLEETKVLARLVDDLRTLSLAESGALALHREPTDVARIASDVVTAFSDQARRGGVTLGSSADGPTALDADPVRVREVIVNLVSNALRYTPSGGSVDVDARGSTGQVEVTVRDTGSGIAPDAVGGIFDRFSKATDSPGAGLGLAIAKSLVEAHGGSIRAESAPGQGTRILFTLPTGTKT